jgi:hypothetical protein
MSSRLTETDRHDGVDCAADGPHCGVCRHVTFLDRWKLTPYCTKWAESTDVVVGEVCSEFDPVPDADPADR